MSRRFWGFLPAAAASLCLSVSEADAFSSYYNAPSASIQGIGVSPTGT